MVVVGGAGVVVVVLHGFFGSAHLHSSCDVHTRSSFKLVGHLTFLGLAPTVRWRDCLHAAVHSPHDDHCDIGHSGAGVGCGVGLGVGRGVFVVGGGVGLGVGRGVGLPVGAT